MQEDEPVEGEVREVTRAVVPAQPLHVQSGLAAVANLSDEEFERNVALIKKSVDRAARLQQALLVEGTDYGSVPGVNRPFLHQPGAEKLEKAYGLATSFDVERIVGDGEATPELQFIVHAKVHVGDTTGPIIAEGIGEASTWERKYRWRKGERLCPDCGRLGLRWVASRNNYWHPTDAKPDGGCGGNFEKGDQRVEGQDVGQVENADPWDLANTLVKMSAKRAHVAGVLRATGTSHLFTQDDDSPAVRRQNAGSAPAPAQRAAPARAPVSASTEAPSAAPGASTAGTDIQIVVSEHPEGAVRIVKDAHREKRWEGERHKLEIVGKIGNRKHTAIVLGELADGAAAFGIVPGDVVILRGAHIEEITWAEDKPPKKEVWGDPPDYLMADVLVGRDGEWVSVSEAAPTLGMDPTPAPTATSGTPAPVTTQPATSTGAEPTRRQGTVGDYEALEVKLTQPIQRTLRGQTLVAIIRGVDEKTGELVMAGLAEDIDDMIGPEDDPWLSTGDVARMYGVWRPNGWYVIDTVGKKP